MATLEGVHPSLRARIEWVIAQARIHGAVFTVNTGFRSAEEQTRLYNAMLVAQKEYGAAWRSHAALAAKPGQSNHQHTVKGAPDSLAVDVGCDAKWNSLRIELFQRAGLCTPVPGEPWHAEERASAALPNPVIAVTKEVDLVAVLPYFIIPNPLGPGYWELKKSDGGVANEGGAPFFGAMPGKAKVVAPLVGLTPCQRGGKVIGYWITDANGNLYAFGDAPFFTSYAVQTSWHSPNRTIAATVQTAGFASGERIRYAQIGIEQGDADYVVDTYDIGLEMKK